MSTYLKTAAMSLLSKTLQTFLSKYLSDVDVEGVALPSVYDGSGWGVRLSNVQLREGIELMKRMPGTVTKKRKRKRRRRILKKERNEEEVEEDPEIEKLKRELFAVTSKKRARKGKVIPKAVSTSHDVRVGEGKKSSSSVTHMYPANEDYDSDNADRPTTPVQESTGVFSCFYNARGSKKISSDPSSLRSNNEENDLTTLHTEPPKRSLSSMTASLNAVNDDIKSHNAPHRQMSAPVTELETTAYVATTSKRQPVPHPSRTQEHFDDVSENEYEYEEEEYEEECEVPLRLCLGENGHIGTLDVRLIGKDLHVLVEDAVITIEAIPVIVEEEQEEVSFDEELGSSNPTGKDDNRKASTEPSDKSSETKKPPAKKKIEHKRDTVGDRVLADNPLARLIASIPHLFLRDIRVRLVVRDKPMTISSTNKESAATSAKPDTLPKPESSSEDTMVEVGIDFLSVTSGEDILCHFQQTVEEESQDGTPDPSENETLAPPPKSSTQPPALLKIPSYAGASVDGGDTKNEYLVRHIRTGRGPSAGVYLQVFTPTPIISSRLASIATSKTTQKNGNTLLWARQKWMISTDNHFLQCSGLDIQARIHMGTIQTEVAGYSWFGDFAEEDDYTDYDSMFMLAGIDLIAPGPQLPLPPMEPRMSRGSISHQKSSGQDDITAQTEMENSAPGAMHPGSEVYQTDQNGIQSCKVPSTFHRVSRGMEPGSCKNCKHLPSETCALCWVTSDPELERTSSLDSSIPMPGLVLQIGLRDPFELNVDRNSLELLGLLKSLFIQSPDSFENEGNDEKIGEKKTETINPAVSNVSAADTVTQSATSNSGFFSSMLYGRPDEEAKVDKPSDAFAPYMQPENIAIMGIYAAKICLRIHVMRAHRNDQGLSFSYWQVGLDCLTIDHHTLLSDEKTYQDVEIDIGRLVWDEYRGTGRKNLCTLGLPQLSLNRKRCDSQTSMASLVEDHDITRTLWPSTACVLLDVPSPSESLIYKNRERHGVQFRFITLATPNEATPRSRSLVHARLGFTTVDTSLALQQDLFCILKEVMDNLVRPPMSNQKTETTNLSPAKNEKIGSSDDKLSTDALMSYAVQIDSGNIKLPPIIDVQMPLTRFCGEVSTKAGVSFDAALNNFSVRYGSVESKSKKSCLSLPQIASLPEVARMHILLCLQDLSSLAEALSVKKEMNPFRRIKAVDKGILRLGKKISKRESKISKKTALVPSSDHSDHTLKDTIGRRRHILSEVMKMNDAELSEMWTIHQRYQKKLAKKRNEV